MKVTRVLPLLCAVAGMFMCCHKNNDYGNAASGLQGQWKVSTDSFPVGLAQANHVVAYTGKDGDFYDFRLDGNLYITEDNKVTIQPYHITSDSAFTLIVPDEYSDSIPVRYYIRNLSEHSVTLINPWVYTPGGVMGRAVYLKR